MDPFEKQQRVESVRGIIKARWYSVAIIIALGFVLKTKYLGGWASGFEYFKIATLGIAAFSYNFIYWLYMRRGLEKISDRGLNIVSWAQIVIDQIAYTIVFYYTGTVETISFLLYFITILIASSLFKARGIILTGLLGVLLHNGVLIAEMQKLIPHITAYPGTVWFGDIFVSRGKIVGFTFYTAAAVIFSVFLSNLIRRREKDMRDKQENLTGQANVLFKQTQELTQTKNWLHEALTKSDKARIELEKAKQELEKTNFERQARIKELEIYGQVTVGREIKMVELKEKIKELENKIKESENKQIL